LASAEQGVSVAKYLVKRTVLAAFILLCSAFLSFALICVLPGEVYTQLKIAIAASGGHENLEASYQQLLASEGLDKPWIVQFFYWVKGVILHGNFGKPRGSYGNKYGGTSGLMLRYLFRPGGELMVTLLICGSSLVVAAVLAVVVGTLTLLPGGRWAYIVLVTISTPTLAVPGFVLAALILLPLVHFVDPLYAVPGLWGICGWQYIGQPMTFAKFLGCLTRLAPIWAIVGMPVFAVGLRVFRASMRDQLGQFYITVARGRGLSTVRILFKHAMRNALNPVITSCIGMLPTLLVNTMFVGFMFGISTYGDLLKEAVDWQDPAPLTMIFVFYSTVLIAGNLIADLGIALADPRIRYA
jgi:peptide/nickel transport system permease protein